MIFSRHDDVTEAVCTHYEGALVARLFKFRSINDYPSPRPPETSLKPTLVGVSRSEFAREREREREPYRAKFLEWINCENFRERGVES